MQRESETSFDVSGNMKQGQGSKRTRGRNGGRRGSPNRQQLFDSNGPAVRIRGNAFQVHEKYLGLARDAAGAGDRVAAENYYQHAEHYFRLYSVDQEERAQRHPGNGQMPDQQRRHPGNGGGQPQGQNFGQGEGRVEMNGANGMHGEDQVPPSLAPESTIELSGDDDDGEADMAPAASDEGGQQQAPARRPQRRRRPVSND
jgi:Domain of unknown function (DUF4167)